jgi:hypothetical protein
MYLRQSTASQEILLGRFVDSGDGDTEKTGLTIANTDIKIWKAGATTLASKNSGGATHIANGNYYAVLDATDTDTLGNLEVHVHVATALSVKREFVVLPAVTYDAWVLGVTVEPTGPPAVTANPFSWIAWLGVLNRNKKTQTATTTALRNDADSSNIATTTVSDDTTTFTRGEWV